MFIRLAIGMFIAYMIYIDARKRGNDRQSAILWAAGALAVSLGNFLVMAIFLAVYFLAGRRPKLVRRDPQVIDIDAVPIEERICCPMCGRQVQQNFTTCPFCSHTLKPQCEHCGRELQREWRTCPYCETPSKPK